MKTKSETLFENWLAAQNLLFKKIQEATTPRPDYLVSVSDLQIVFELKELTEDGHFNVVKDPAYPNITSNSRILGDHVRRRIEHSKRQLQYGAHQGIPSILLIYNNLDPGLQMFGTEQGDFVAAMYGTPTILVNPQTLAASEVFNGKDSSLQPEKNTSFSAVGHLCDRGGTTTVTLFENTFAKVRIEYDRLPSCFDVQRIEVSTDPLNVP